MVCRGGQRHGSAHGAVRELGEWITLTWIKVEVDLDG